MNKCYETSSGGNSMAVHSTTTSRNLPWSCDSFVALGNASATGAVMLGKNSDRPVFDSQALVRTAHCKHPAGEKLQLAYVSIPEAEETCATVGSAPYWCWGYEEGMNEHGVAIGNEAIFTKGLAANVAAERAGNGPQKGLLGMELLRLGLERGKTARESMQVITSLLEEYGQWGSGVPTASHADGAYDNSYIIADPREAWVLETAGGRWIARLFDHGTAAISNQPSIRTSWDLASDDVIDYAISQGWWPEGERSRFDFAFAYTDFQKPLQVSQIRVQRSRELLKRREGDRVGVDVAWMKRILRDHYEDTFLQGPYFNPALPDFLTLCMHSSPACFTWGNTASSAIFVLPQSEDHLPMLWWSPVTPCTGLYVPAFMEGGELPALLSKAGSAGRTFIPPSEAKQDQYVAGSYWWLFRDLLDRIKRDERGSGFLENQRIARGTFDELERTWVAQAAKAEAAAVALRKQGQAEKAAKSLADFTAGCINEALSAVEQVKAHLTPVPAERSKAVPGSK
jgi:secernin